MVATYYPTLDQVSTPLPREELEILARQFHKEGGHVSLQTRFNYAWGLIKSNAADEQREGLKLLTQLFKDAPDRRREVLFYMSVGCYKLGDYTNARRYADALLEHEPANPQVNALRQEIEDKLNKEGLMGVAIVGGAVAMSGQIGAQVEGYVGLGLSTATSSPATGSSASPADIARLVCAAYKRLPSKGKPLKRSNGVQECTILAGVVLELDDTLECVAVATGVKATPDSIIGGCGGKIVHDMHAEILALRAFNRWLLEQIDTDCQFIERTGAGAPAPQWRARPGLRIYLYISAPPCGDGSLSLLAGEPWGSEPDGLLLRGRNHFDRVGYLRTKPGRADSELTMSKSCSDKLALKQRNGLLMGVCKPVFEPAGFFLDALVTPDVLPDYTRAFSRWPCTKLFSCWPTTVPFEHAAGSVPSPVSTIWTPCFYEVLAGGVRQGCKPGTGKGQSVLCRFQIAKLVAQLVAQSLPLDGRSYLSVKDPSKYYPPGWQPTAKDDFLIEH